jgi:alpha-aminoadipic semialdehyde synthase
MTASNSSTEAKALSKGRPNACTVNLDVSNKESLLALIKQHDVVVSFVPAGMHPKIAELCIEAKKHMVTASYISPDMKKLHSKYAGLYSYTIIFDFYVKN